MRNLSINSDVDYLDTWRAMEKLVDLGLVKSIGLSNFNSEQVDRVVNESRIKPVLNQVECSPTVNQKKLTAFCKERGVTIVAYCPLASQKFRDRDEVKAIAAKYNKTNAQICLRYLVNVQTNSPSKEFLMQSISLDCLFLRLSWEWCRFQSQPMKIECWRTLAFSISSCPRKTHKWWIRYIRASVWLNYLMLSTQNTGPSAWNTSSWTLIILKFNYPSITSSLSYHNN